MFCSQTDSNVPFVPFSSWDVFRTVHPLLSLTSPREWADIVNAYVDGWRDAGTYFSSVMGNMTLKMVLIVRIQE